MKTPMNCIVCDKKLRSHNKIGTCRKHRAQSPVRRAYEAQWQEDNHEQYVEAKNRWNRKHPEYFTNWRNAEVTRQIAHKLRTRLNRAVRGKSAVKNLGCEVSELKAHLEGQFTPGMSWENYGKWEIDHIKPLSSFNLEDPEQLKLACNYNNLQPLWKADNIRKHAKLDYSPKSAQQSND
jgi:hypothetical protein